MLAVLLALGSAFLFACGVQCIHKGLRCGVPSATGTVVAIFSAVAFFIVLSPAFLTPSDFSSPAVLIFVSIGLFRPAISANLANLGNHILGATLSASLSSITPVLAIIGGVFLLQEELHIFTALGAMCVVLGVVVLTWRGGGVKSDWPVIALLLPFGTAFFRALGQVVSKYGMSILPNPFLNTLVSMSTSLVIIGILAFWRNPQSLLYVNRSGGAWFAAAGLINGIGAFMLNISLNVGSLVISAPIVGASPVFTMLLGRWVFKQEVLGFRQTIGVLVVSCGIGLVGFFR